MGQSLGLSSSAGVFECPKCKQTINTSLQSCPFCSAAIDSASAQAAAEKMAVVNAACSDASYIRIMAGLLWALFGLSLIPFVAWLAGVGYLFLAVAVPFKIWRWRRKLAHVDSVDPELERARRIVGVSFLLWLGFVLLYLVLRGLSMLATR